MESKRSVCKRQLERVSWNGKAMMSCFGMECWRCKRASGHNPLQANSMRRKHSPLNCLFVGLACGWACRPLSFISFSFFSRPHRRREKNERKEESPSILLHSISQFDFTIIHQMEIEEKLGTFSLFFLLSSSLCGAMAALQPITPHKESTNQTNQHSTQPQKQSICSFLLKLNDFVGLLHRSPLVSLFGWLPCGCCRP